MIRLTVLFLAFAVAAVAAVRYWYHALCGLVLLTVLSQHPSMPTNILGIQGMNPWNALLLIITVFWIANRRKESSFLAIPPACVILLALFVGMTVLTGLVAAIDSESFRGDLAGRYGASEVVVDTIVNPLKYLLVGIMFFDGARTRARVRLAMFSAVVSGLAYSLMLFKSMKLGVFTIGFEDARRLTDKLVGLFANDLAELFAFTVWGGVLTLLLVSRRSFKFGWAVCTASVIPPFLALKSRSGFLAFVVIGAVLGIMRWRWILVALPLAVGLAALTATGVRERVLMGVAAEGEEASWDEISAGRITNIWPPTIDQIKQSPVFGHGRYAILREQCYEEILIRERRVPNHPHNSYLEVLIDAGVVGLSICIACCVGLFRVAWRLIRNGMHREVVVIGGLSLAALVAELTAGITGSSFFPSQSSVPYLCIWGAAVRVYADLVASSPSSRFALARPSVVRTRWKLNHMPE